MAGNGAPVEGDIFNELGRWRNARNERVHASCKLDEHGYAYNSAEILCEKMWETAKKERVLADLVKYLSTHSKKGQR